MKRRPMALSVTSCKLSSRLIRAVVASGVAPAQPAEVRPERCRCKRTAAQPTRALSWRETLAGYRLRFHRFCEIDRGEKMRRKIPTRRAHNPTASIASCKLMPLEVNEEIALAIVAESVDLPRLMLSEISSLSASLKAVSMRVAKATTVPV